MSNSTTTQAATPAATPVATPARSISSQIDQLVSRQLTNAPDTGINVSHNRGGIIVNTATGEVTVTHGGPEGSSHTLGRINDVGLDVAQSAERIKAHVTATQARLDEHTFDPKTGAPVYALPIGSRERDVAELVAKQARESAAHDLGQLGALERQRAADAAQTASAPSALLDQAARSQFAGTGSDRLARLKAWDDAAANAEATAAVAAARARRG